MKEAVAAAGLPPPKIGQTTFFTITFKRPMLQDSADVGFSKESVGKGIKGVERGVEKGVERGVENLSVNEKTIYGLIRKNPSISKQAMAAEGNLTKKTIEYNLLKLKVKGLIKRIGPDRGGCWEVVGV